MRSKGARVGLGAVLLAAAGVWAAAALDGLGGSRNPGDSTTADRSPSVAYLPDDVRHRARAVASMTDGGFMVATAAPAQLLRFSPTGARAGDPIALRGDPVSAEQAGTQILLITRAPDGVTVLDRTDLRLIDTLWLHPARVKPPYRQPPLPRLSGDIQRVAVFRGMVWAVTGDRDGEPAVLRFRTAERQWDVPGWSSRPEGIIGSDADGLVLRLIGKDLWGVTATTSPSSLYHMMNFVRIDEFGGHDLALVSCATDIAESAAGNPLFLSCGNELQEVVAEGGELRLISARPTLPSESGLGRWTDEIIARDSGSVIVALNTEVGQPNNRPGHARIAEVDSAGAVTTLLDMQDAVVRAMAVTPRSVVALIRLADGRADAIVVPRRPDR
jgi:hypothetical protein